MDKTKTINSWEGFETQKEKLILLASNYKNKKAETKAGSNGAFEYIPEGIETNLVFNELVQYHKYLVSEAGLDYFMVRNVWDGILGNSQ